MVPMFIWGLARENLPPAESAYPRTGAIRFVSGGTKGHKRERTIEKTGS